MYQVNAFSAFQPILTGRAIEPVVACTAVEVVAITTINRQRGVCGGLIGRCKAGVCSPTREQHIVAIATQQPVVELAADEHVIACPTEDIVADRKSTRLNSSH